MKETRKCAHCSKDFEASRKDKKYCSDTCRSKASLTSRGLGATTIEPQKPDRLEIDTRVPGVDVRTQFVIDALTRDRDRWERQYDTVVAENKLQRDRIDEQKETITKMETDKRIADMAGPKKSTLDGLGENPMVIKLLEIAGPAIGSALQKLSDAVPTPGAAPMQQVQGLDANNPAVAFMQWLSQQPESVQRSVIELLVALTRIQDENTLMSKLGQIENMVMGQYMSMAS